MMATPTDCRFNDLREHKRIERLMLFSHVAKALNFSRAAEHLGISRGHLSEQIKFLERELGTSLLNRSTRQVSLTKAGKQVLDSMGSIESTLMAIERDIAHEKNELEGELRITAPLLFAHRYLNDICDSFHQLHPEVTFTLNTSYESHDLNKPDFDVAFRATNNPPLDMVARSLINYRHVIVASPSYVETYGAPQSIAALAEHQCLAGEGQNRWRFKHGDVGVKGWIALNDNFSIVQQVINGRGIARLPDYFVDKHINDKRLFALLTDHQANAHQIFVIHPPKIQQSARLKMFLGHVNRSIGDLV